MPLKRSAASRRRATPTLYNVVREGFAHYKAVTDASGTLVDLLVLDVNPAGARLTGVAPEAQIGRTVPGLAGIDESLFEAYRRVADSGETAHFDHEDATSGRSVRHRGVADLARRIRRQLLRHHRAQGSGGGATARERRTARVGPAQGRVHRHPVARAAQPARADPDAMPLLQQSAAASRRARAREVIERQVTSDPALDDLLDISRISAGRSTQPGAEDLDGHHPAYGGGHRAAVRGNGVDLALKARPARLVGRPA